MYNIRTERHVLIASVSNDQADKMFAAIDGSWQFHQTPERGNQQVYFFTEKATWGKLGELEIQIFEDYYMVQR